MYPNTPNWEILILYFTLISLFVDLDVIRRLGSHCYCPLVFFFAMVELQPMCAARDNLLHVLRPFNEDYVFRIADNGLEINREEVPGFSQAICVNMKNIRKYLPSYFLKHFQKPIFVSN